MQQTETIGIVVNGEGRNVPGGLNIGDLLLFLGVVPDRVAVELDRRIVRKAEWPVTAVSAGAQLEIVQFVGGG
jgi:thiamine biosynthesis protein ThiS